MSETGKRCCLPDRPGNPVHYSPVPIERAEHQSHTRFCRLSGGWFDMGSDDAPHAEDGEAPCRSVWVDDFAIAATAVSNRDFERFVRAAGYLTQAEQRGSSFVFQAMPEDSSAHQAASVAPWWRDVPGACWRTPEGPGSLIENRMDYPVVHVSYQDALAYCQWSGCRLPTEAEWEYAARAGLARKPYPWGDLLEPEGEHRCNIWQGDFPARNSGDDGFIGTAPVTAFKPNAFGLYNMTGNVWEWVADRFTRLHSPRPVRNPKGPLNGEHFVAKGGSFLCHHTYCLRYRNSSRQSLSAESTTANLGFRVARRIGADAPEPTLNRF
jgi:formylglycine-generating enzyme required for sulfatase activity